MPLKLKHADDLDSLGINPDVLTDFKAQLRANSNAEIKCPNPGHLIGGAKSLRVEIRKQAAKAQGS